MPPTPISPTEILSRFVTSKQHYRPSNNTIKWNAFMPNKGRQTSVFRTSGISDGDIWSLGDRHIQKQILGRGDIVASKVTDKGLEVVPDDNPERHANILGWADYDDRSKNISIAQQLEDEVNKFNNFYLR